MNDDIKLILTDEQVAGHFPGFFFPFTPKDDTPFVRVDDLFEFARACARAAVQADRQRRGVPVAAEYVTTHAASIRGAFETLKGYVSLDEEDDPTYYDHEIRVLDSVLAVINAPQPAEPVKMPSDDELAEFMWEYADEERTIPPRHYTIAARALLARYGQPAETAPLSSNPAPLSSKSAARQPSNREQDLAMAIRRIVSSARRNCEDNSNVLKIANEAWSLLVRLGLEGSPLRDTGIESAPVAAQPSAEERQNRLHDALDVLYDIGHQFLDESSGPLWDMSNRARDEYDRQMALPQIDDAAPTPPAVEQPTAQDREDAERWRWLRDNAALDDAIDAARKEQP